MRRSRLEEDYPFYHPKYIPPDRTRDMKQIKADFNKHLQKHSLSKVNKKK